MTTVRVTANGQGEYWFDVEVAGERKSALMDTGFTGAAEIAVNRANWDRIKDTLREKGSGGQAIDYQGNPTTVEYGKGTAKIVGFETEVEKLIIYAGSEDDLLGSNFFHNFPNLEMNRSFRDQTMTLTEISADWDDNGEQDTGHKETEEREANGQKQILQTGV
jgi:predicted aspartyl protease